MQDIEGQAADGQAGAALVQFQGKGGKDNTVPELQSTRDWEADFMDDLGSSEEDVSGKPGIADGYVNVAQAGLAEVIFNCSVNADNLVLGWSDEKKEWCCKNDHIGCSEPTAMPQGGTEGTANGATVKSNSTADGSNLGHAGPAVVNEACFTRGDPLAVSSLAYAVSPPGTPCVFGVDDRDEGSHCIMDDGRYGSFGWCFTDKIRESWGSCGETCPLVGQSKILGDKLQDLNGQIAEFLNVTKTVATNTTMNATTSSPPAPADNLISDNSSNASRGGPHSSSDNSSNAS